MITTAYTTDILADEVMSASSSANRDMTEAWTMHFRENARIEGDHLHYLGVQIGISEIKQPHAIGKLLRSKGAVLIEGMLAHHLETAIPHIAAYLLDEHIQNKTGALYNPRIYRHFPNNEFLNPLRLFSDGPLIKGEIEYEENVIWAQHALLLKDTILAEVIQTSLQKQRLDSVYQHPFIDGSLKIENIIASGNSVMIHPEINLRSMRSLRIYRTAFDGSLLTPNEASGL